MVRLALKVLVLSLFVLAAAFALRRAFLWEVMPVSWHQPPQPSLALQAAFLLRTIENLAVIVGAIALGAACLFWVRRRKSGASPGLPDGAAD